MPGTTRTAETAETARRAGMAGTAGTARWASAAWAARRPTRPHYPLAIQAEPSMRLLGMAVTKWPPMIVGSKCQIAPPIDHDHGPEGGQRVPAGSPVGSGRVTPITLVPPRQGSRSMNNLHRELAPISSAAWAQIEDEAARTLKRHLAGRRVVDVNGPSGDAFSAVGTGHLQQIEAPQEGILARQRLVAPLTELRVPFRVERTAVDDVDRGSQDSDW